MRLQINKDGKESVYTLINSWSDVTLDKWIKLISKKEKTTSQEAIETLSVLTDIPKKLIKDIEEEAWRYLVDSFTNTYQRNLVLAYLSLVMENIPRGVKEKILPQCKSNSAESLVQFLCREKRGPVRLQNERLKAKEIILPFKL